MNARIYTKEKTWETVTDAEPVCLPYLKGAFAYHDKECGIWSVTEPKTGLRIGAGFDKPHAVNDAIAKLKSRGRRSIERSLELALRRQRREAAERKEPTT